MSAITSTRTWIQRLATVALLSISASSLHGQEFTYISRLGLYDEFGGNEFTRIDGTSYQSTQFNTMTESGYITGFSERYNGAATQLGEGAWMVDANYGNTVRVGFYDFGGGNEFTRANGQQQSSISFITESGFLYGSSQRYNGTSFGLGEAAWIANIATGITTRAGFYDFGGGNEFTRMDGLQESYGLELTGSGYLRGESGVFNGGAFNLGNAAWVANVATGLSTRIGLFGGSEFTKNDGTRITYSYHTTESGYTRGESERFNGGASSLGYGAWSANASNGVTSRIGLYDFGGGNEFTGSNGYQNSYTRDITESGYVIGNSDRRVGGMSNLGAGSWVANASGVTTRIGLFGGAEFTSSSNYQYSDAERVTNSGYVTGYSSRYNNTENDLGSAAWVANAGTGVTTRIGLYDFGGGNEFTDINGYQNSSALQISNAGYIRGTSMRYNGGGDYLGTGVWVANASSGATTRLGFFGETAYTSNTGYEESRVEEVTESGYLFGFSSRYNGGPTFVDEVTWVANAASGVTTRIGLYNQDGGNAFITDGSREITESGYVRGFSNRASGGEATWVANAATGVTTRTGLFDQGGGNEFTANDGYQLSVNDDFNSDFELTESGYLHGYSQRYNGGAEFLGRGVWLASAISGTTVRVGEFDAVHTSDIDYQYSEVTALKESGFAAGYSERYNGDATQDGQTAWLYDLNTNQPFTLELSVRPSDGYAYSTVSYLSENGVAVGYYNLFSGETFVGNRAFAYLPGEGAFDIGSNIDIALGAEGWAAFTSGQLAEGNFILGSGELDGFEGAGVFLVVPEPGSGVLLLLGAACGLIRRRKA